MPTSVLTVAVLFAEFGSVADELTDTESAITVPLVVPLFTFTTSVNVPAVNPAMFTSVQTTLPVPPVPGVMQLHPAGARYGHQGRIRGNGRHERRVVGGARPAVRHHLRVGDIAARRHGVGRSAVGDCPGRRSNPRSRYRSPCRSEGWLRLPPPTTAVFVSVAGADWDTRAFTVIDG